MYFTSRVVIREHSGHDAMYLAASCHGWVAAGITCLVFMLQSPLVPSLWLVPPNHQQEVYVHVAPHIHVRVRVPLMCLCKSRRWIKSTQYFDQVFRETSLMVMGDGLPYLAIIIMYNYTSIRSPPPPPQSKFSLIVNYVSLSWWSITKAYSVILWNFWLCFKCDVRLEQWPGVRGGGDMRTASTFMNAWKLLFVLRFFFTVTGDLLNNYCSYDPVANATRLLFACVIMLTYPIECFVAREVHMSVL